jgi:hypothetical protein
MYPYRRSTIVLKNPASTAASAPIVRASNAEPSRQLRSRRTNDPFSDLSKNTATGRRVADLLRGFLRAMGDPTDAVLQANALRAAELTVAAETARAQLLAGDSGADPVVRLEGMAARSVRALGIGRNRVPASGLTLGDILKAEYDV